MLFSLWLVGYLQTFICFQYVRAQDENEELPDEIKRHLIEDNIKPAIFGSYNYDPVKQKFEPHKYDLNKICPNKTGSTIFEREIVMGTTTISTSTDPPQGAHHGSHNDTYPTNFFKLRVNEETTPSPSKSSLNEDQARTHDRLATDDKHSTTTKKKKKRRKKKKSRTEKYEKGRRNADDSSYE